MKAPVQASCKPCDHMLQRRLTWEQPSGGTAIIGHRCRFAAHAATSSSHAGQSRKRGLRSMCAAGMMGETLEQDKVLRLAPDTSARLTANVT